MKLLSPLSFVGLSLSLALVANGCSRGTNKTPDKGPDAKGGAFFENNEVGVQMGMLLEAK